MGIASALNFVYCLKAFRRPVGSERHQLKYILLGFGLAHSGAILHFVPAYLNWEPFPHDLLLIAFASIITYAIVQHRLMDITLVLNRGIVYVLLLGMLLVPTYVVSAIHHRLTVFSVPMLVIGTLALACAFWVVLSGPRAAVRFSCAGLCLALTLCLFGGFLGSSSSDPGEAEMYWKIGHIGVVLVPAFAYHFSRCLAQPGPAPLAVGIPYGASLLFLLLLPSQLLLDGVGAFPAGY